jgi:translocation protein SEC63
MHIVCDSYVGFDYKQDVTLVIEDASKAVEVDSDDDISEPDEGMFPFPSSSLLPEEKISRSMLTYLPDTIAGQMAALKGQTTSDPAAKEERAKRRAARRAAHDEESDMESGTDEDEDSESETDTDTDSDEE